MIRLLWENIFGAFRFLKLFHVHVYGAPVTDVFTMQVCRSVRTVLHLEVLAFWGGFSRVELMGWWGLCGTFCCLSLLVLSVLFVCVLSCRLWQFNYNFWDLGTGNLLICIESEIDLNHMGNLLVDITKSLILGLISIALLLMLKRVLFYFTHYGS